MSRTDRLYALREELRRAGAAGRTAARLAEHFEVSERTIKRDISTLQQGGFPVWARPGPGGGYAVDTAATLPPVNFTDAEVAGLAAAVAAHRGQPFDGDARAALTKILGVMEPAARERATAVGDRVWIDHTDAPLTARTRRAVERALREKRVLNLRVRPRGAPHEGSDDGGVTLALDPIFLGHTRARWYLVGLDTGADAVVWIPLTKIETAHVTAEPSREIPVSAVGTPPPTARPTRAED